MENDKFSFIINYKGIENIEKNNDPIIEVAKIRDISKGKDVLWVLYEKEKFFDTNHLMFTNIINGRWCAIIREEELDSLKNREDLFKFGVFHELGHFLHNDYDRLKKYETGTLSENRKTMVNNNQVMEEELQADEFATRQLGKNIANRYFDYRISKRKKIDNSPIAIKELELRKKHIKKIQL